MLLRAVIEQIDKAIDSVLAPFLRPSEWNSRQQGDTTDYFALRRDSALQIMASMAL